MGLTKAVRAAMALLALSLVAACSAVSGYRIAAPHPSASASSHIDFSPATLDSRWLNGVALPSMGDLRSWESKTGEHPSIIAIFAKFGAPLPIAGIRQALAAGALPLVQLDPSGTLLGGISDGQYDQQLRGYAKELKALNDPVLLSFGHEMNGVWYSWGCGQASPAAFRAAWRHIHQAIRAPKVTWVWTINDVWQDDPCSLRQWYPGSAYVDWIGIDGYLRGSILTFHSAFARTLAALRPIARGKPVFLAETGVAWGPNWSSRLNNLYRGAHRAGLRGIVYFDDRTSNGDYRPQVHPLALVEFRNVLRQWN
jgi:mannan endo-1,4-beta-mannosidase